MTHKVESKLVRKENFQFGLSLKKTIQQCLYTGVMTSPLNKEPKMGKRGLTGEVMGVLGILIKEKEFESASNYGASNKEQIIRNLDLSFPPQFATQSVDSFQKVGMGCNI